MKHLREIKFKTNEAKSRFNEGKTCFQGKIIHNLTLDENDTMREFREYCRVGDAIPPMIVNMLGTFIAQELAKGNRLDFGPFSVSINLRGGFPAANAPFDPARNSLSVELTPSAALKKSLNGLKPVNTEPLKPRIDHVLQIEPLCGTETRHDYNVVWSDGHRKLNINGMYVGVKDGVADEGLWIESESGEKLVKGAIYSATTCTCDFTLDEHLDPGHYWVAIYARYSDSEDLLRARRRIKVIPNP